MVERKAFRRAHITLTEGLKLIKKEYFLGAVRRVMHFNTVLCATNTYTVLLMRVHAQICYRMMDFASSV